MTLVSQEEARRIAVRAQLLDGSAKGVLDTVRRLGFLQIDPISTVAPSQKLVLWSRLGRFASSGQRPSDTLSLGGQRPDAQTTEAGDLQVTLCHLAVERQ
jgi:hypothetical protein